MTFQSIVAGDSHSRGVTSTGVGYCRGQNCCGQPGIGADTAGAHPHSTLARLLGGLSFRASDARFVSVTCRLTIAEAAYCWGSGGYGNLVGTGDQGHCVASPKAVAGGPAFQSLTTGITHTCALTSCGVAYRWGGWQDALKMGRTRLRVYWSAPVAVVAP